MKQYNVSIWYKGIKCLNVRLDAKSQDEAENKLFSFCDNILLGPHVYQYDTEKVELYFLHKIFSGMHFAEIDERLNLGN